MLGGAGIYHRMIQLTSPAVGYTTFCDPFWYVCYPAAVSVDNILGDRSSNDFGIDFGGGMTFGHEAKFYVETRYHYVWGPTITGRVEPAGGHGDDLLGGLQLERLVLPADVRGPVVTTRGGPRGASGFACLRRDPDESRGPHAWPADPSDGRRPAPPLESGDRFRRFPPMGSPPA